MARLTITLSGKRHRVLKEAAARCKKWIGQDQNVDAAFNYRHVAPIDEELARLCPQHRLALTPRHR